MFKKMTMREQMNDSELSLEENQTLNQSNENFQLDSTLSEYIAIVIFISILITGLIGNSLNILVFSKKRMKKKSTFRYLLYLSLSDFLVLVVGATDIIISRIFNSQIRTYSTFACKFHTFCT